MNLGKTKAQLIEDLAAMSRRLAELERSEAEHKKREEQLGRAEEALKLAERNFRNSVEDSPLGIHIHSYDNESLYANKALLDIYGYASFEELKATPLSKRTTPESYAAIMEKRERRKQGQPVPESYEVSIVRKDGEVRHIRIWIRHILWNGEKCQQALYEDITERNQVEGVLKQSKENLNNFMENSPLGIVINTNSGETRYANKASLYTYGYSSIEEYKATPLSKRRTPESYAAAMARRERIKQGLPVPDSYEVSIVRKDGEIRYLRFWIREVIWDGERCREGLSEDITKQKKVAEALKLAEQNLRNSIENSPLGIHIHSYDKKSHYANRAFLDTIGYNSVEEFEATPLIKRVTPETYAAVMERRERINKGQSTPETYEMSIVRKDGEIRHIIFWRRDIVWYGEGCHQVLCQDVTEQKQMAAQLTEYREHLEKMVQERTAELTKANVQLEATNKELEAFAYSVSHDLRAPLRSIDGFSQALLDDCADKLDEQGKDYLKRVCAAAGRMGELIDDMLSLSRVTRSEMRHETVDLSALAQSITATIAQRQPGRLVESVIPPGLATNGDRHLLELLLVNLLDNAWKFTNKQPIARIEFGTSQDGDKPVYYVRDNGVGFDMTYVNKLFAPFQRLHEMSEFPGTGIGLAIVQRIVSRHGGRVWAEGEVGKGAAFYFSFS